MQTSRGRASTCTPAASTRRRARVSGLVPTDLAESIAAVRAALDGNGDLAAAALWLANGLDGTR